ncbi:DUF3095 domain-containing protein [Pontixanthobacter gangjinensis]|uniref:DUF3095 domain-containing protein n=1 Tax=Christiangramia aestuarii TaxID=1028746 RepID=A0A7K1LSE1_9FLAO|nr:DUF3095 family protein [Christiangramia aestuarii]MUP43734.1 DUF3095 domain-containing protein [Christiangramia aestuarii]
MSEINTNFYSDLAIHDSSISELIGDREKFCRLPDSWHILVADIRNSTQAVAEGKHNNVNLVATGCVIAILNLAESNNINVPFFFGGDGAVFLIPEELKDNSLAVLEKHNQNARKNFNFSLSIGSFSIADIYRENIGLQIARVRVNKNFNIPVILGTALQYAENRIKNNDYSQQISTNGAQLDLSGMECKWDRIRPPMEDQEVISLIIEGCEESDFSRVYSKIMAAIDDIYGSVGRRKPISVKKLKIKAGLHRINAELRTKLGRWSLPAFLKSFMIANFGELYLKNTKAGMTYLQKLVELSDNLSLDGRINTVITGNSSQRKKLTAYLDKLEKLQLIRYGYHVSEESIMSCYVKDTSTDQHVHFIDGGDGGYTKAANHLKSKYKV